MRTFLLCSLLLSVAALTLGATTPPDGTTSADPYCLLDGLLFTNGLRLVGDFKPTTFNYQCTCDDTAAWNSDAPYSTQARPHLLDPGSSAEVTFNGVKLNSKATNNAISNGGDVPKSGETESLPLFFEAGRENVIVIGVSCNGRGEPQPCYYEYTVKCWKPPTSGGSVVGDPQFVGLRGQNFQVHGVSGEIYNIVSDVDLQYNSRFVFLSQGKCPVIDGKKQKGCWSHPGSYLGELGLKTRAGDKIHILSGDYQSGFAAVEVNGRPLELGSTYLLQGDLGSVTYNSTHTASVQIGKWDFAFENSDMFINQKVRVTQASAIRSHGLLGQTWRETTYPNAVKYVQGAVDDYVIREGDIFGDNFVYNNFN